MILITNNPKVQMDANISLTKETVDGEYRDVLIAVRDRVHKGHRLLSHPLSGSVKPNETPYKSVLLSRNSGQLDLESLHLIEESIEVCDKFLKNTIEYGYNTEKSILEDFSEIDQDLILSAIAGAENQMNK